MVENVTLAPAAGSGVGKLIADRLLAEPGFVDRMAGGLLKCLDATTRRWDKETETWLIDPDFQTILKTIFGILSHMEGEPIKRIIHQHLGGTGTIDPLAALQESPALREAASALLAKAEYRTGGGVRSKARAATKRTGVKVAEIDVA